MFIDENVLDEATERSIVLMKNSASKKITKRPKLRVNRLTEEKKVVPLIVDLLC